MTGQQKCEAINTNRESTSQHRPVATGNELGMADCMHTDILPQNIVRISQYASAEAEVSAERDKPAADGPEALHSCETTSL